MMVMERVRTSARCGREGAQYQAVSQGLGICTFMVAQIHTHILSFFLLSHIFRKCPSSGTFSSDTDNSRSGDCGKRTLYIKKPSTVEQLSGMIAGETSLHPLGKCVRVYFLSPLKYGFFFLSIVSFSSFLFSYSIMT